LQLAAVIQHSALHFCGNTGALHLAVMTQTPTVAWFWPNPGTQMWVPAGGRHRIVMGANEAGAEYLRKIETEELVRVAASILNQAEMAVPK